MYRSNEVNIVLSGGGIKGIAFAGVFDAAEKKGFRFGNIAGVSAGALAGSFAAAGYKAKDIFHILSIFDFEAIKLEEIQKKVPAVARLMDYSRKTGYRNQTIVDYFIYNTNNFIANTIDEVANRSLFSNIITYSMEGCLFDGDYLEEWVYNTLAKKGIRTFADLRTGNQDASNPKGYKIRMTAVDADRKKVVVLPDDITFYGINPDKLEVAKAVRMSSSVPFAFKPVVLKNIVNGIPKTYHLVDGGVIDNFPSWLISKSPNSRTAGFKLSKQEKNSPLLDNPMNVFKSMVTTVYNTGVPQPQNICNAVGEIDTGNVNFLDFSLSDRDKEYLYQSGKRTGSFVFEKMNRKYYSRQNDIVSAFRNTFRIR